MDNYCARSENFQASELSIAKLDVGSIQSDNGAYRPKVDTDTAQKSLPGIEIVDSQSSSTNPIKACLSKEANNPKPFAALSSVSLANCDPEFKILIKDIQNECPLVDQKQRSQTARKLIEYTREDDKYRKVLEPFMNDLFNEAYPFPKVTDKN